MENKYRFRDSSLSFDERVKDLLSRLTIKEKAGLMSSHMAAVPRLDIGEWYVGAEVARGYVSRNPDVLLEHLRRTYPGLYFVSSTTKVLTDFSLLRRELERPEFRYVVADFRLNRAFRQLGTLPQALRDKTELLCNECCAFGCRDRAACYRSVSRENLGLEGPVHRCTAPDAAGGYEEV